MGIARSGKGQGDVLMELLIADGKVIQEVLYPNTRVTICISTVFCIL